MDRATNESANLCLLYEKYVLRDEKHVFCLFQITPNTKYLSNTSTYVRVFFTFGIFYAKLVRLYSDCRVFRDIFLFNLFNGFLFALENPSVHNLKDVHIESSLTRKENLL